MLVDLVELVVWKSLQFLEICVSAKARELFEDVPYYVVRGGSSPAKKKYYLKTSLIILPLLSKTI